MLRVEQFLEQRPALKLHYYHEGTFADFARHYMARVPNGRSLRLVKAIGDYLKRIGRTDVNIPLLTHQLQRYPIISTADHTGLLHLDILYNANLMMNGMLWQEVLPYQVVLSTGRIPLDNASNPRGFRFAGMNHNFFPKSMNKVLVSQVTEGITKGAGV
jgi:hypothetical protein